MLFATLSWTEASEISCPKRCGNPFTCYWIATIEGSKEEQNLRRSLNEIFPESNYAIEQFLSFLINKRVEQSHFYKYEQESPELFFKINDQCLNEFITEKGNDIIEQTVNANIKSRIKYFYENNFDNIQTSILKIENIFDSEKALSFLERYAMNFCDEATIKTLNTEDRKQKYESINPWGKTSINCISYEMCHQNNENFHFSSYFFKNLLIII
jgi:hypothetical protein